MNVKNAAILMAILLVPVFSFAQGPQVYSWDVNPPNVASVSWTNEQIAMFLDSVTDSVLTSTISDFKFADLNHDGQLELLAAVDFSGREQFNTLEVVRRVQNAFSVQRLDAYDVRTLSGMTAGLASDGRQQLLVSTELTPYIGADKPQAKWTAIYGWSGPLLADASTQFSAYYRSAILGPLKRKLDSLRATAPNSLDTDIAQIEYDKVLRVSGQDPTAGLARALLWAGDSDPVRRIFASAVLADIGTNDALTALNTLLSDADSEVALDAKAAVQALPDLHFMPVQIDIKPGDATNPINLKSKGTVPVAILSSPSFNAPATVDANSLTFGSSGAAHSLVRCNGNGEDVNGDRLPDLVCHFDSPSSFQPGDAAGTLKGRLKNGTAIKGVDSILIVNN
jgi:hypothetical protein